MLAKNFKKGRRSKGFFTKLHYFIFHNADQMTIILGTMVIDMTLTCIVSHDLVVYQSGYCASVRVHVFG